MSRARIFVRLSILLSAALWKSHTAVTCRLASDSSLYSPT